MVLGTKDLKYWVLGPSGPYKNSTLDAGFLYSSHGVCQDIEISEIQAVHEILQLPRFGF